MSVDQQFDYPESPASATMYIDTDAPLSIDEIEEIRERARGGALGAPVHIDRIYNLPKPEGWTPTVKVVSGMRSLAEMRAF